MANFDPIRFFQFDDVAAGMRLDLMGMVIDPTYTDSRFVYACYTYHQDGSISIALCACTMEPNG
jgi:hypothetical protein